MKKPKIATVWIDGCSGCHMSLLDMDERILDLLAKADLVYSPLVDMKEFPEDVDVTLIEGAVSSDEDEAKVRMVRKRSRILVALGDCAVTANVLAMRNVFGPQNIMRRAYLENIARNPLMPNEDLPTLLPQSVPVHGVVKVDLFLPGCPPSSDLIYEALESLIAGKIPELETRVQFG